MASRVLGSREAVEAEWSSRRITSWHAVPRVGTSARVFAVARKLCATEGISSGSR